ncbi:MAG TPA: Lrp/AsnC family transcriptional regulator [Stellaceae bacterium]|nr:Lrp/AsnC family transcriptional regulator [Stellaceae bacterium]
MPAKQARGLDAIDVRILSALQRDGRMTIQKLAGLAGLSPRPCLERVRRLRAAGIIAGFQAVIDLDRLSKPVTVFAELSLTREARLERIEARLKTIDDVVECWEISGASDYLVRFICEDLARYEALTAELLGDRKLGVARILSHIVLRPVSRFAGYPTSLLGPRRR